MTTPRYLFGILFLAGGIISAANPCASAGQTNSSAPLRYILDMVHDNPGEPPQPTAFRDPQKLADWGYNGQVVEDGADFCETFDTIAPGVLARGSETRTWIEAHAQNLEQKLRLAHTSGIKAYAWFQFIVLPKVLVAKYKQRICDQQGRIDLKRPFTQKILRTQINEIFERCPDLDGLVVRTGEVYLHDSPYHTASGSGDESKTQGATAIIDGPESHIALLKLLREEACVKRGKTVIYRTWDFGNNFHVNTNYYLKVTGAIAPHANLVFSVKHQAGDFLRMTSFNPTLGIGSHQQIVEVQCQREAYGKGAHPYYVGNGVINGWEEDAVKRGLHDLLGNTNFAGVWTWSRGGGWGGPYISNELWCALNAYVTAKFAQNPQRAEPEIFNEFATQQLHLSADDAKKFRELNLLSAAAVLRGQCSQLGPIDLWWARDDFIGAPDLHFFVSNNLIRQALAEKAEAVTQWKRIESLAQEIRFRDPATQDFVETSCAYGHIKYSIFEQAWTILLFRAQGDATKQYDRQRLSRALADYDRLWGEWRELNAKHSFASLYKDVAFGNHPGIGAVVEQTRNIVSQPE